LDLTVQTAYVDWLIIYVTTKGCPKDTYRVHRSRAYNFDTVSEGIAFGMLITSLMDNQEYFDGFWRYYKHYLNKAGLMSWQIDKKGKVIGYDSATEADENAAMALLYADKQWTSIGEVDYLSEGKKLINKILSFEVEKKTFVLKPGAFWGGSNTTNPMYFDPAYYRIWAKFDPKWKKVSAKSYQIYDIFYQKNETGLFPDWCQANGSPTRHGYDYYYDACQTPIKIGLDYLWHGKGKKHLEKLSNWIKTETDEEPLYIVDGYKLDGTVTGKYHNAAFVGPFMVAAMVSKKHQAWLDALYDDLVNIKTGGRWGYYQDSLRLISLIIVSGKMPNIS